MKKLSIVLALIMALSCFSVTAFAAESTEKAPDAVIEVTIIFDKLVGENEEYLFTFEKAAGSTLTAADVLAAVKARLASDEAPEALVDPSEYVLSDTVIEVDKNNQPYNFTAGVVEGGATYDLAVCAAEINDFANFTAQLGKLDWAGIAKANVALWNQIINGIKAAIESLVNAEWPECGKDETTTEAPVDETTTEAAEETPDTGVSAVAGAAVVVLALSATTAVVLRKKED